MNKTIMVGLTGHDEQYRLDEDAYERLSRYLDRSALRLQDEGHDDQAIAVRLGLAPAAVGPLLRVAAAKLHTILAAGEDGT